MSADAPKIIVETEKMIVTVTNQPTNKTGVKEEFGEWTYGACDCCGDCEIVCEVCWCPCLSQKAIAEHLGEDEQVYCLASLASICFFQPGLAIIAMIQRGQLRQKHGIEGGALGDFMMAFCCTCCAIVQSRRQGKDQVL